MIKSTVISELVERFPQHKTKVVEQGVRLILSRLESGLINGERIEIRGFGSFSLHERAARMGRNPKTGEPVFLEATRVPHFKPGKALRNQVNQNLEKSL